MSQRILRSIAFLLGSVVLLALSPTPPARAAMELLPVSGLLHPDGTLNLAAHPHGAFDLRGWNVTLDAARGPVFAPANGVTNAPDAVGDWSALGSDGAGNGSLNGPVAALAVSGTDVYVGGFFFNVNNNGTPLPAADFVAKWDGTNWSALGSDGAGNGSLNLTVLALAVSGSDVYVGGDFSNVNNNGTLLTAADYVAKWDGTNWSALGSNGAGNGSLGSSVAALAVRGTDVYVGGFFFNVNNSGTPLPAADRIAKWDGTNWSALGSDGAGDGSLNNVVFALAASGTDVYVGGAFTDVNNNGTLLTAVDYVAKWDGTNWSALGSDGASNGSLDSSVEALALSGTNLYVGGNFTDANNNGTPLPAVDYVAKWDGTNWSALGSNGASNGSLNSGVEVLTVSGSDVYVGGGFTDVNNNGTVLNAADFLAKWDGTNWSALGSNGASGGSLNSVVLALAFIVKGMYVGGAFTDVNNNGTVLTAGDFVARVQIIEPTAVTLTKFSAKPDAAKQRVQLKWVTGTELQVLGFNAWVREGKNGENTDARAWQKLNKQLLAAKHPGGVEGASYSRMHKKVKPGRQYSYKLEVVKADGTSEWSEVVKVKAP